MSTRISELAHEPKTVPHGIHPAVEGERRKQPRAKLSWPVRLFRMQSGVVVECTTQDLSSSGFYCLSTVPLNVGEPLLCILTLPAHDPREKRRDLSLQCKVRVVRVDTGAPDDPTGIACRIEDYHFSQLESINPPV